MVVGVPLLKLIPLAWKLATKPIESAFKSSLKRNPKFKANAISIGETYNYYTVSLRCSMNGVKRTPEQIRRMSKVHEGKAMDIACDVATNFVSIGLSIVFLAVWQRYQDKIDDEKKEKKAERRRQKDKHIQQQIAELSALKSEVSDNQRSVEEQKSIISAQKLLIDEVLNRLSGFESMTQENKEVMLELMNQNKVNQEKTVEINEEINSLKNKPKGLDRFNVQMQMPKQKPLDDE
jgi:hypothetical protein